MADTSEAGSADHNSPDSECPSPPEPDYQPMSASGRSSGGDHSASSSDQAQKPLSTDKPLSTGQGEKSLSTEKPLPTRQGEKPLSTDEKPLSKGQRKSSFWVGQDGRSLSAEQDDSSLSKRQDDSFLSAEQEKRPLSAGQERRPLSTGQDKKPKLYHELLGAVGGVVDGNVGGVQSTVQEVQNRQYDAPVGFELSFEEKSTAWILLRWRHKSHSSTVNLMMRAVFMYPPPRMDRGLINMLVSTSFPYDLYTKIHNKFDILKLFKISKQQKQQLDTALDWMDTLACVCLGVDSNDTISSLQKQLRDWEKRSTCIV